MLRKPRPLPQRFNRTVTPQMRRLVEKRHERHKQYKRQRWRRFVQRIERKVVSSRKWIMRFGVVGIAALVLLAVGLALFSPLLDVREIRVARTDPRLDNELIQQALHPLFGQRMPVIDAESVLKLLTSNLPDQNRSAVPDLQSVTISRQYPSTLQVRLTLKPLVFHLLIQSPDHKTVVAAGSGADYLTQDGLYVTYQPIQVPSTTALKALTIVDWGVRPSPWTYLLTPAFLKAMADTESQIQSQFQQTVSSTTVYLRAREYHLQLKNYALWFDFKSPIADQLHRYSIFLQSAPPGAAKQYVDLRIPGKIIYK